MSGRVAESVGSVQPMRRQHSNPEPNPKAPMMKS